MKKLRINEAKKEIKKAQIISVAAYLAATLIWATICVAFNIYVGYYLIAPVMGAIISGPVIIKQEKKIRHYNAYIESKRKGE